jgi:muconolactone delta-isomerase
VAPTKEVSTVKFLVTWQLEISRLTADMMKTVLNMADYAKPLEESGKVLGRYHIVGSHGGAWIYNVESNDELEMLLARSPVNNFAHFQVYPRADMSALPVRPPDQG